MPLYVGDYLGDTVHLSCMEHGAYLLLLMCMWRAGGELPDDDVKLAKYCRTRLDQWRKLRPVLEDFFQVSGGVWTHTRVRGELKAAFEKRTRLSEIGARGGEVTAQKNKGFPAAKAAPQVRQPEPEPESKPYKKETLPSVESARASPFEAFWEAYGHKKARADAAKAFTKAIKLATLEEILLGVERYHQTRDWLRGYRAHPATWLNAQRWLDGEDLPVAVRDLQEPSQNQINNQVLRDILPDVAAKVNAEVEAANQAFKERKLNYDRSRGNSTGLGKISYSFSPPKTDA